MITFGGAPRWDHHVDVAGRGAGGVVDGDSVGIGQRGLLKEEAKLCVWIAWAELAQREDIASAAMTVRRTCALSPAQSAFL